MLTVGVLAPPEGQAVAAHRVVARGHPRAGLGAPRWLIPAALEAWGRNAISVHGTATQGTERSPTRGKEPEPLPTDGFVGRAQSRAPGSGYTAPAARLKGPRHRGLPPKLTSETPGTALAGVLPRISVLECCVSTRQLCPASLGGTHRAVPLLPSPSGVCCRCSEESISATMLGRLDRNTK